MIYEEMSLMDLLTIDIPNTYYAISNHRESMFFFHDVLCQNTPGDPKKVLPFEKNHQTMAFSAIVGIFLDFKYLSIDLDFDT